MNKCLHNLFLIQKCLFVWDERSLWIFFPQKDPPVSKDPSVEETLHWDGKRRREQTLWIILGLVGEGVPLMGLKGLTRHTVSTQAAEPQLLELKGASQLSHPSFGVTGEETEATTQAIF